MKRQPGRRGERTQKESLKLRNQNRRLKNLEKKFVQIGRRRGQVRYKRKFLNPVSGR